MGTDRSSQKVFRERRRIVKMAETGKLHQKSEALHIFKMKSTLWWSLNLFLSVFVEKPAGFS